MKTLSILILLAASVGSIVLFGGGTSKDVNSKNASLTPAYHEDEQFNRYWYNNEAELTHFDLKQARYGQIHEGNAVMIFVTEHISPRTLLKGYNASGTDIPAFKMNFNSRFFTGLYPYSVMTSVFTPANLDANPTTMKATFGMQEWCGHVYASIEQEGDRYRGSSFSYFPDEGNEAFYLPKTYLEDEIWNRIRIDYQSLPTGNFQILPSQQFLRMKHKEFKPLDATATLKEADANPEMLTYILTYPTLQRTLEITFSKDFPHFIEKWKETSPAGPGASGNFLTTEATATKRIMLDYWNRNSNSDAELRKEFGIQ